MPVETSDCGSRSTTRVRTPRAKAAEASPSVTVVLPTPPLRELTLSTCTKRLRYRLLDLESDTSDCSLCGRPRRKACMFRRSWSPTAVRSPSGRSAPPYELGARTVAVYPYEDRNSLHRLKADEAYQIGEPGHPVRAYLDVVRDHPRRAASPAPTRSTPATGSSPRTPSSPQAAAESGITFIGPPTHGARDGRQQGHGEGARDRRRRARAASRPPASRRHRRARRAGRRDRLPDLREGGRRRRRPRHAPRRTRRTTSAPRSRRRCARPTARSATRTMFLEQAVLRPRHIEVQILADATGETVHLFERDCSVQRRHQKVIEIAPAPNLADDVRQALYRDADRVREVDRLRQRRHGRVPARHRGRARGPARLHRDEPAHPGRAHRHRGGHRRRPRAVADAHRRGGDPRRPRPRPGQHPCCAAPRCSAASRPRTRRRASGPTPARSRPTARPAAPASASTAAPSPPGAQISPHFDSMLAKLTCRGRDFPAAVARAKRGLAEFRIRGVSTNIPFLQAVLDDPGVRRGRPQHRRSSTSGRSCVRGRASRRTAARRSSTGSPTSRSTSRTATAPACDRPGEQAARRST